jgi:hypothetical protein
MRLSVKARHVPGRLASGAFILHSGLEKWKGSEQQAIGMHGMASGAYPFLKDIPPKRFLRMLSIAEISLGAALLTPAIPAALAGGALTAFAGGLLTMYWRTPGMRKPGSVWPTREGLTISKDVWMLGIGVGLLADAAEEAVRQR